MQEEISKGYIAIETEGMRVIIHIMEKASFESGLADVRSDFQPVLVKISGLIDNNSGDITISGHTDNVPIANTRFRSNWELATSRAVSVAHELLSESVIDPVRVQVTGHADTQPRAPNDTADGRARNRRVDISIVRGAEIDQVRQMSISGNGAPEATVEQSTAPQGQTEDEDKRHDGT